MNKYSMIGSAARQYNSITTLEKLEDGLKDKPINHFRLFEGNI